MIEGADRGMAPMTQLPFHESMGGDFLSESLLYSLIENQRKYRWSLLIIMSESERPALYVDSMKSEIFPRKRMPIAWSFLLLGFASMVVQAILIREFLVVFYGNELSMGLVLGLWLFSIAIGAFIYGRLEGRVRNAAGLFAILLTVCGFLPLLQLLLVRVTRIALAVPAGTFVPFFPMVLWTTVVALPYGIVVGFIFPLGCRLASEEGYGEQAVTKLYSTECLGALLGGVSFCFFLVGRWPPLFILWGIAIVTLLFSLMQSLQGKKRHPALIFLLLGSLAFMPFLGWGEETLLKMRWRSLAGALPLVRSIDSRYENLALTRQEDQFSLYGNGQYVFSFPDPYQNKIIAGLILAQHRHPRTMLVVGATSGGFLKECLDHGLESLSFVLLDRAMIDLIKPFRSDYERSGYESEKIRLHLSDGRAWVRSAEERYDVIFCALPDPSSSMINRFYTVEFFSGLRKILTADGILAITVTSSPNYLGSEMADYNASLYATLSQIFPHIIISPGDVTYLFASMSSASLSVDPKELEERLMARGFAEGRFPAELFEDYFNRRRIDSALSAFHARKAGLNSDMRPITYYYNLMVWDRVSGSRLAPFLRALGGLHLSLLLWCATILALLRLFQVMVQKIPRASQEQFTMKVAVGIFGFSAMAIEIVLLFAYQNLFGYLYGMIGLLVASFMGGMTAGSLITGVLLRKRMAATMHMMALQLVLLIFAVLMPNFIAAFSGSLAALLSGTWLEVLFFASMAFAGLVNGIGFPLACHLAGKESSKPHGMVGSLNAVDHLGAALGGFLPGTFLVPLLGTAYTCYAVGILALMAMILWVPLMVRGAKSE
jgi:predicted membrane-bound spermidine synthase